MKLVKGLLVLMMVILLTACGEDITERTYANFAYLNFEAIELGTYPNNELSDKTNKDKVKSLEDEFVKWTATVSKVVSDKKIYLQEENLGKVEVKLMEKPDREIEVGDVVTVSGKLTSYVHGIINAPTWKVKKAVIIETSDEDKQTVTAYQEAFEEQEKALAQKDEEESKELQVAAAAEAAEQEALMQTTEGKIETLIGFATEMGVKEVMDIRDDEDYWVIEVRDSLGITAKLNRSARLDKTASFFEKAFTAYEDLGTILVIWNADLHDLKGNESVDSVMEIELTSANAATINWDDFSSKNLPEVVDNFWELNIPE